MKRIAIMVWTFTVCATAQSYRMPVYLDGDACDDAVGKAYVYYLRDELSRSAVFQFINADSGIGLRCVSIPDEPYYTADNNASAAISIVITFKATEGQLFPLYINQVVAAVGFNKAQSMAQKTVHDLYSTLKADHDMLQMYMNRR